MDPVKRTVLVKLTDDEVMARADELVSIISQHEAVEHEMKDATKGFRKRLKGLDRDRDRIAKAIEQRAEEREIDCDPRPDYREGVVRYMRAGTDEEIDRRELSQDERQMGIGDKPDLRVMDGGAEQTAKKKRGRPKKVVAAVPDAPPDGHNQGA